MYIYRSSLCGSIILSVGFIVGGSVFLALLVSLNLLVGVSFLDHPVEHEIVLVTHAVEEVLEQLAQVTNIGFLLEFQATAVVQVDGELLGEALSQRLN